MRLEQDGLAFWFGTPDAPAPSGCVEAHGGTDRVLTSVEVGLQPPSASNAVQVIYSRNGDAPVTVPAALISHDTQLKAQYFIARFPEFHVGDAVDYFVVARSPGLQVPGPGESDKSMASFKVVAGPATEPTTAKHTEPPQMSSAHQPYPRALSAETTGPSSAGVAQTAVDGGNGSRSATLPVQRARSERFGMRAGEKIVVSGRVTWPEGAAAADLVVRVMSKGLREMSPVGEALTDARGSYQVSFDAPLAPTAGLLITVLDSEGQIVITSPLVDRAVSSQMDLVMPSAVAGRPSQYERLTASLGPLLSKLGTDPIETRLAQLTPTDLEVLQRGADMDPAVLSDLITAAKMQAEAAGLGFDIPADLIFGLIRKGVPGTWLAVFQHWPRLQDSAEKAISDGIAPTSMRA
jgi:hypothetical protein